MLVSVALNRQLLLQPSLGPQQPLGARAPHRLGMLGTTLLEPLTRRAQPAVATLTSGHDRRQLIPAAIAEGRRLGGVGLDRLVDDRASDLLIGHAAVTVGVGRHLGAVDRDHANRRQAGVRAQRQHLAEQVGQRVS